MAATALAGFALSSSAQTAKMPIAVCLAEKDGHSHGIRLTNLGPATLRRADVRSFFLDAKRQGLGNATVSLTDIAPGASKDEASTPLPHPEATPTLLTIVTYTPAGAAADDPDEPVLELFAGEVAKVEHHQTGDTYTLQSPKGSRNWRVSYRATEPLAFRATSRVLLIYAARSWSDIDEIPAPDRQPMAVTPLQACPGKDSPPKDWQ